MQTSIMNAVNGERFWAGKKNALAFEKEFKEQQASRTIVT